MSVGRKFKKGETIFLKGEPSDCAFIISSGAVEIIERTVRGEKVIGQLTENEIFGEMGLIDGQPRSATARAIEDSVVYVMTRNKFDLLARENPEALLPILKVLTSRLRETMHSFKGNGLGRTKINIPNRMGVTGENRNLMTH
ncbi:MAG: cyclic nucleotide-binding domain-containing protein [Nitrospinota bacterium]